jgi:hypothetical protein
MIMITIDLADIVRCSMFNTSGGDYKNGYSLKVRLSQQF